MDHGRKINPESIVDGLPHSFYFNGCHLQHLNDNSYSLTTGKGRVTFRRGEYLIVTICGEVIKIEDKDIVRYKYQEEISTIENLDFGSALLWLKAGKAVARKGWNGKGMFVYLVPGNSYPAQTGIAKAFFGEDAKVPYEPYLAIKNVSGTVSTWVPSVNDCLAEDWLVVEFLSDIRQHFFNLKK